MSTILVAKTAERIRNVLPQVSTFENEAPDRIEGTGSSVIEVRDVGPWGRTPNGARHRLVRVNVLSDVTRDEHGMPTQDDADRKAWALWETIDDVLHNVAQDWAQTWAAVHSSRRSDGPVLTTIPNGDGGVMLSCDYEVSHD